MTGASCLLLEQEAGSEHDKAVSDRCKTKKWEVTLEKAPATASSFLHLGLCHQQAATLKTETKPTKPWREAVAVKERCSVQLIPYLRGPARSPKPLLQLLADEAMHTHRKEMHKLPLKCYLFLLTFAAQSQLASFTKGPCHWGRQPFQASPDPAYKRREKCLNGLLADEAAGATSVSQMPPACSWPRWLLSTPRLKIKAEAWTMVWRWAAVSFLWKSILACHLANRICKSKRNQCKRRLSSKIPWVPWAVTDVTIETVCPHRMVTQ